MEKVHCDKRESPGRVQKRDEVNPSKFAWAWFGGVSFMELFDEGLRFEIERGFP